jgi:hypothetical protein
MRMRVRVRERGQKGFHPSSVADSSPSRAQVIPAERSAMSQASGTSPARALARAPVVDSSGKERSLHHEPGAVVLRKTPSELFTTMRKKSPLVQCLQTQVSMDITENVLLAAGASPYPQSISGPTHFHL